MTKVLSPLEMPGWPAAMNQQMAAAYCGVSVDIFVEKCPIKPVAITPSRTGQRYLRQRLDEWLLSLDNPAPAKRQGIGAVLRAKSEAQRA